MRARAVDPKVSSETAARLVDIALQDERLTLRACAIALTALVIIGDGSSHDFQCRPARHCTASLLAGFAIL